MNLFIIKAANNCKENFYISGIGLNGKPWDKNYITHDDLLKGGTLGFAMTRQPDKTRGTGKESWPYSMSK